MLPVIALGAVFGAKLFGAYSEANAARDQAQEQARSARFNALVARLAAGDVIAQGNTEAGMARMAGSQVIGEQRVAAGASGIDPGTGLPAQLAAQSRVASEMDARTIANNAAREAWGLKVQARNYDTQAKAARKAAGAASWSFLGSSFGAIGSVMGGK
jgi:hypothetical protein